MRIGGKGEKGGEKEGGEIVIRLWSEWRKGQFGIHFVVFCDPFGGDATALVRNLNQILTNLLRFVGVFYNASFYCYCYCFAFHYFVFLPLIFSSPSPLSGYYHLPHSVFIGVDEEKSDYFPLDDIMHTIHSRLPTITSPHTGITYKICDLAPDLLLMDLNVLFIKKRELSFLGVLGEGAFGKVMSAKWEKKRRKRKGKKGKGKEGEEEGEVVAVKVLREETEERLLVGLLKVFFFLILGFFVDCLPLKPYSKQFLSKNALQWYHF